MNMTTDSILSQRLTAIREEKGIKRQKAADDIGISRASLEFYEKGKRKPDSEVLVKICEYYGVSADYLLGISNAQITATDDEQCKNVCDYTGLSEKAVITLRGIKEADQKVLSIYDSMISSHELNLIAYQILEIATLTEISSIYARVGNKIGMVPTGSKEFQNNADIYDKYIYNEQEAEKQIFLLQKHFIHYVESLTSRDKLAKSIDPRLNLLFDKDGKYLYDLDEIADERYEKELKVLAEIKDKYKELL